MANNIVIFHADCSDGFGSYWAANRNFRDQADYWAAYHGDDEYPDVIGKNVYILDFCYKRPVMELFAKKAKSITVIDHHISNMKEMEGFEKEYKNVQMIFDMEHSGCVLAWKYFHNNIIPILLQYIEDRDLWNWSLQNSDLFLAALDSFPMSLKTYDAAANNPASFIAQGEPIIRFRKSLSKQSLKNAVPITYSGHDFVAVNETHRELISEVGNMIVEKFNKPAFVWRYDHQLNKTVVSLRSNDKCGVDVSKIAKDMGGGGHKYASGLSIDGLIKF